MKVLTGRIYGYQDRYGNWVYVGGTTRPLIARHKRHKRQRDGFGLVMRDWPGDEFQGPFLLEEATGKNRRDLLWNMAWQETVWMFKHKTFWPIFGQGRNQRLPSFRFVSLRRLREGGKKGGLKGGQNGGRNGSHEDKVRAGLRVHELHPNLASENNRRNNHNRCHVRPGITNPNCPLCVGKRSS
jgi:hypothetical protein